MRWLSMVAIALGACSSPAVTGDAGHSLDARAPRDAHLAVDAPDASALQACPASGPCYVMPLGDSITYGVASTDGAGYRRPLQELVDADGFAMAQVGTQTGPYAPNEGHSGWEIQQLTDEIDRFLAECNDADGVHRTPNVVLLMIGTNDINRGIDPPNAPARLGALVDRIALDVPDARIVLAQIIPNGDAATDTGGVATFNAALPALVQARPGVELVDMHSALDPATDLADRLHPNDAGYDAMAAVWYSALRPELRQP